MTMPLARGMLRAAGERVACMFMTCVLRNHDGITGTSVTGPTVQPSTADGVRTIDEAACKPLREPGCVAR